MQIAITGMGAVTPMGNSIDELWSNVKQGHSCMRPIQGVDSSVIKSTCAGQVENFQLNPAFDSKLKRKTDRLIQFAMNATHQAVAQSGLDFSSIDPFRVHTILGGAGGTGYEFIADNHSRIHLSKPVLPSFIPGSIGNGMSTFINTHYGIRGSGLAVLGACVGGSAAISVAAMMIETGRADVVITGASDASIGELFLGGLESLGAISYTSTRPFSKDRDGFQASEGAAVLILERADHARARGAKILAYLSGHGLSSDCYHHTDPDPEGISRVPMIQQALREAGLESKDIDYINAHATGTSVGDPAECTTINRAFAHGPYVSSTKCVTGHFLGASAAVEAVITVMSVIDNVMPGTVNLADVDPACDVNHVTKATSHAVNHAVSNSFGFGGSNGVLIFSKA